MEWKSTALGEISAGLANQPSQSTLSIVALRRRFVPVLHVPVVDDMYALHCTALHCAALLLLLSSCSGGSLLGQHVDRLRNANSDKYSK